MPAGSVQCRTLQKALAVVGSVDALGKILAVPTADLESLAPLKPDEAAFGVSYDEIDDFLEGRHVSEEVIETILGFYRASGHKRSLPADPFG